MMQSTQHRSSRRAVALAFICALALSWLASASLSFADTPPTPQPSQTLSAKAPQAPEPQGPLTLGLYLAALLMGLAGIGGYVLWRARPKFELEDEHEDITPSPLKQAPPPLPLAAPAAMLTARPRHDSGRFNLDALKTPTESSILKPLFTTRGEGQQKICPSCKKTYAAWMVICPVDASPLQNNPSATPPDRRKSPAGRDQGAGAMQVLTRQRCPACQRRLSQGALFCPHDGKKLLVDTIEDAATARTFTICRRCGLDPERRTTPCAPEGCDVVTLDPSSLQTTLGMAMTMCPRCHSFGKPGQLHCAHDEELLVPMTAVELNALPHTGYGPRRKLCRKCGTRFGGDYAFCAYDGAELTPLN